MASKALNAANLEALGATRLARLLIEISEGNPPAKRRLRLELAGADSPTAVAKEIRKRIATIARSRSFIDWQNRKSLVDDLEAQHRAIVEQVATRLPAEGLDLMWRFLDLAESIFVRCDDSSGAVIDVFHSAVSDLAVIASSTSTHPEELADRVFEALIRNDHGQFDYLIQALAPALGPVGLEHLKQRMIALSAQPVRKPAAKERKVIGWSSGGAIYADEIAESSRVSTIRLALQEIADAQGDVDAFIAQYAEPVRRCQRSPPRSHAGCSRPVGPTRLGRFSRRPSLGAAVGLISNGKMPGSTSWTRGRPVMKHRQHAGPASNEPSPRHICASI
jgi:hypothetical protein